MLTIGYWNGLRLPIESYNPRIHIGNIVCADGHILIAKKGSQKKHHYAHRAGEGNNECSREKGDWHVWWQSRIKQQYCEFRFKKDNILKIADSVNSLSSDTLSIVEFQNSVMSAEEMAFREAFYTRTDLLNHVGLPYCRSELTWIFNLNSVDIDVDVVFGDIVCFQWKKGTRYMWNAKAQRIYYDIGRKDLIQLLLIHDPKRESSKMIGRLIPLAKIDKLLFNKTLNENLTAAQQRLDCNNIADYEPSDEPVSEKLLTLIKRYYFKSGTATKHQLLRKIQDLL